SARTQQTVKGIVNEYEIGSDSITGTFNPTITHVKLIVDGVIERQSKVTGGTFAIYAKDKVTSPTQKVEIAGYIGTTQEVIRKSVSIK
ncbi:hypothetical protein P4530_29840, partial [Bacillus thuringiensis]|nr:hypothetical protein [Bacillus thuringiensis]